MPPYRDRWIILAEARNQVGWKKQALVFASMAHDQQRQSLPHQVTKRVAVPIGLPTAGSHISGFEHAQTLLTGLTNVETVWNKPRTLRQGVCSMPDKLTELRIREEEAAREWQWLQDTLNKVARGRAGDDEVHAFRLLQHQAVVVGQRRVELQIEMARLEGHRT
jgi:hypothetical protein